MRCSAAILVVLAGCLAFVQAQPPYEGSTSFINSLSNISQPLELPGASLTLITAGQSYGLNVAGMSGLLTKLQPCTILQPHTHPHSELAYVLSGEVYHSTPYNNLTLFNLTANTGKTKAGGFAVFPAGQLHVTYNDGCDEAIMWSVFNTQWPSVNFYPYAQSFFPSKVTDSYFGGSVSNGDLASPVGTAELQDCKCKNRKRL